MINKHSPAVGLVGFVLYPLSAYASFNSFGSSPLCSNVDCALWTGGLLGIVGVPRITSYNVCYTKLLRLARWCTAQRGLCATGRHSKLIEVQSNPPVNTDACGRAAMHLARRARAGYRER